MKRLLLTLILGVLATLPGLAETVTFDAPSSVFPSAVAQGDSIRITLDNDFYLIQTNVNGQIANDNKGTYLQVQQKTFLEVCAPEGCTITKTVWTSSRNAFQNTFYADDNKVSVTTGTTVTWEGSASSVKYYPTGGTAVRVTTIEITYTGAPVSDDPELGDITYSIEGVTPQLVEGKLLVNVGDVITFKSQNASTISYKDNNASDAIDFEGSQFTYTVNEASESIDVTASKKGDEGEEDETKTLNLSFNIPLDISYTVNGESVETVDGVLSIFVGDVIAFDCPNASGYSVSVNDGDATTKQKDYTYTVRKNSEKLSIAPILNGVPRADNTLDLRFNATEKPAEYTDVITIASINANSSSTVGSSSYSNITFTMPESKISYAANIMQNANSSIQVRKSSDSQAKSGIITTANPSGYVVKSVSLTFDGTTQSGRYVAIYGNVEDYSSVANLYSTGDQGKELGRVQWVTNGIATQTIDVADEKYTSIGIVPTSGAAYISKIEITWIKVGPDQPKAITATHFGDVFEPETTFTPDLRLSKYVTFYSEDASGLMISTDGRETFTKVKNPYRYTISPEEQEQSVTLYPYITVVDDAGDSEDFKYEDLIAEYNISPLEESLKPHLESVPTLGQPCSAVWYGAGNPEYHYTITSDGKVVAVDDATDYRINFTPAKERTCVINFVGMNGLTETLEYTIVDKIYYSRISSVAEFDDAILRGARVLIASNRSEENGGGLVLLGTQDYQNDGAGIAFSTDFTVSGQLIGIEPTNTTVAQLSPDYLGYSDEHEHYHYTLYCNPTDENDPSLSGGFLYLNTADKSCYYDETQLERHFELTFNENSENPTASIHLVEENENGASVEHYLCFCDNSTRPQFESNENDNPENHQPVYIYVEVQAQTPEISFEAPDEPELGFEEPDVRVYVNCVAVPAATITYTVYVQDIPTTTKPQTYNPEKGIVVDNTCTIKVQAKNSAATVEAEYAVNFRDPVEGWVRYENKGGFYPHSVLIEPLVENFYPEAVLYYSVDGNEYVEYTEDSCIILGPESALSDTYHHLRFKTVQQYRGKERVAYFPQLTKDPEMYTFAPYAQWTRVTCKAQLQLEDFTAEDAYYVLFGQGGQYAAVLTREELIDNDANVTMNGMPIAATDINDGTTLATGADAMRFTINRFGSGYVFCTDVENDPESPEGQMSRRKYLSAGINELGLVSTPESATSFSLDFTKNGDVELIATLPVGDGSEAAHATLRLSGGSRGGKFGAYTALNGKSRVYLYRCCEETYVPKVVKVKNLTELPEYPDSNETYVVTEDLTAVFAGNEIEFNGKNYTELYLTDSKGKMILVAIEEENPRNVNLWFNNGQTLHEVVLKYSPMDAHELTPWVIDNTMHHIFYTMQPGKGEAVQPTAITPAKAKTQEGTDYVQIRYAYLNEDGTIEGIFDEPGESVGATHTRYLGSTPESKQLYHVDAMLHNGTVHVINSELVSEADPEEFVEINTVPTVSFSNDIWNINLPADVNPDEVVVLYHKASGSTATAPDIANAMNGNIYGDRALVTTVDLEESNAWYGYAHDDPATRPQIGTSAYYEKYYGEYNNGSDYDLGATFLYEGPFYSVPAFMRDDIADKSFSVRAAVYRPVSQEKADNVSDVLGSLLVDLGYTPYQLPADMHNPAAANVIRRAGEQSSSQGIRVSVSDAANGTPTGVSNISIDNNDAAAEYYDLQGRLIRGQLVPGIYIRRAGSDVRKVTVR